MENLDKFVGKVVQSVELGSDDALHFMFADGSKMKMWDDGQSCCESRYMTCDDDLSYFSGSKLLSVEVKYAQQSEYSDYYETIHEVQFLEVMTDRGCFTMATHNEHNGYYGGFCVRVEAE